MSQGHLPAARVWIAMCAAAALAGSADAGDGGAPRAWLDQVTDDIRESEYHFSHQDGAWSAPNRVHDLRSALTEEGLRLTSRTRGEEAWSLSLRLTAIGREGALEPPGLVGMSSAENRSELRGERVTEWYVNDERGLEHGFTIHAAPEALGDLILEVALGGDLLGYPTEDARSVLFRDFQGQLVLLYRDLVVLDATERELPARLELSPGVLRVRIDDREAVYPLAVDPLMTSPTWTDEGDQAGAHFGASVATTGDVNGDGYSDVIVGVPLYDSGQTNEGRAYVYMGSAAGLAAVPVWMDDGDQADAHFGASVATAGDVNGDGRAEVIVGAPDYDGGETDEGAAYVYDGSASGLEAAHSWARQGNQTGARFGFSVSTAGDVNGDGWSDVIVGAPGSEATGTTGHAYAYMGTQDGLSLVPAWTESSNLPSAFGRSVSTAGDVNGDGYSDVIVGVPDVPSDLGYVAVYHGSSQGLASEDSWTVQGGINPNGPPCPLPGPSCVLGSAVAPAGDVNGDGYADVLIRAEVGTGSQVHLYLGKANLPDGYPVPAWIADADASATAGDVNGDGYADVIVGMGTWSSPQVAEGRADVYLGSAAGLAESPTWTVEGGQAGARYGASVATAGDVNGDGYADVIVGAFGYDNGESDEGRALVYLGSAAAPASTAEWNQWGTNPFDQFGISVATAGDVNGDGYSDVIVGAPQYDNGQLDEGRAYVYPGKATGLSPTALWIGERNQAMATFGRSVSTAGDVNGDGYSDIIVGADFYDNVQIDEGRAFVYHSNGVGFSSLPQWTAEIDQASAYFGRAVGTAGDVNGDGFGDVIVGAPYYDGRVTDEGLVRVYLGSSSGLAAAQVFSYRGDQASAYFGAAVGTAGDVNRDGRSDIVVGAPYFNNVETNEGRVFVFRGSASGVALTPVWTAESNQASAYFGRAVGTAGDVNGDGYSDLVVGAPSFDNGSSAEGRAYLYLGSSSGLVLPAAWIDESDQAGALYGTSVGTAGDVNGDGYSDVIVGASYFERNATNEGRAYVYFGSATGLGVDFGWSALGGRASALFGSAVASAGDVNGDGYADVLVGAPGYDSFGEGSGQASLFYGNEGRGLSLRPRQRRANADIPVAALGKSDGDRFKMNILGRTPFGRGRVRFEWQVAPLSSLLAGASTTVPANLYDTGVNGVSISSIANDLLDETPYKWRVRVRYDSATTPLAPRSRWLTPAWNGRQEWDLRTGPPGVVIGAGAIPDDDPWPPPLLIDKGTNGTIKMTWSGSCVDTDMDYGIYEGRLGDFTSHWPMFCSTGGMTEMTFTPYAGAVYFLVVPSNGSYEGSYGRDSTERERRPSQSACMPQVLATCE